ncbi:MAG: histidinol phosphate phosphatase, partial [Alphaproteobacteria bacterium]|nr:histidinol phosphate phosphatase [Alphaproteobacteria bacterium]
HGDLVVEAGMNIHDYLSLVPVVTGAGGLITDWRGAALTMASAGQVAAAGDGRVHAQALEILGAGAG